MPSNSVIRTRIYERAKMALIAIPVIDLPSPSWAGLTRPGRPELEASAVILIYVYTH